MIKDLTIIFTVRIDSETRFENVKATLSYYRELTQGAPTVLLEADSKPKLREIMRTEFPEVDYIFIQDENPIFHRTHYINEEFRRVKTQNAAVIDSDVIVPKNQLIRANKLLLFSDEIMVFPYDGRFIGCDAYMSNIFRQRLNPKIFEAIDGNQQLMFGFISVGGAYLVNVNRYKTVGWENENFPGWGPEDFEREHRLDILGHKPKRIMGKIFHLNHPRGINSSNSYSPLVLKTKREYCRVCAMSAPDLMEYIASWPWV
ncbi:MAG: hypothetical protein HDR79_08450 [Bacteroides sp.]|nr:hypothetical protein [Bacteroides sp.]MBD5364958.1 hypothetical protein [Bacteroides sp.]